MELRCFYLDALRHKKVIGSDSYAMTSESNEDFISGDSKKSDLEIEVLALTDRRAMDITGVSLKKFKDCKRS